MLNWWWKSPQPKRKFWTEHDCIQKIECADSQISAPALPRPLLCSITYFQPPPFPFFSLPFVALLQSSTNLNRHHHGQDKANLPTHLGKMIRKLRGNLQNEITLWCICRVVGDECEIGPNWATSGRPRSTQSWSNQLPLSVGRLVSRPNSVMFVSFVHTHVHI